MIAILGGTAAYYLELNQFGSAEEPLVLQTPFGEAAPIVPLGLEDGTKVFFTSRHGTNQLARSAAYVNHRANLWAIHQVGAKALISWNGVGGIAPALEVGDLVVPDDLLDRSRARVYTFGPGHVGVGLAPTQRGPGHVGVGLAPTQRGPGTGPFDLRLRQALVEAGRKMGERVMRGGVYVATEGPRLETAAEIEAAARDGATVVGMTLSPEVWLAQELGLPFASLAIVTNRATGTSWREPRRDFSPNVGQRAFRVVLEAARALNGTFTLLFEANDALPSEAALPSEENL